MDIRLAREEDIEGILNLYEMARQFMSENKNPNQWGYSYPSIENIKDDMSENSLYICEDKSELLAVFCYKFEDDKDYAYIEQGSWLDDSAYGVVHRIATKRGTNGIGAYCIDYAYNASGNLRIDTHEDNIPMRNLLKKLGFIQCGFVYVRGKNKRIAFQKIKQARF